MEILRTVTAFYKKRFVFICFFISIVAATVAQPNIIPLPVSYDKSIGVFTFNEDVSIVADNSLAGEQYFLQNELLKKYEWVTSTNKKDAKKYIVLSLTQNSNSSIAGTYTLSVTPEKVLIKAADKTGIFYGIGSLLQLIATGKKNNKTFDIECWHIADKPMHEWRGLMLDESRHFFGKEKVKSILDWMAFYKLNKFHWHLTDEPGWRIQIKKYPMLALIGGIGNYKDSTAAQHYYTQEEIKEVIAYAALRHIEVIPEIDMPGHARAANRAYPQYSGGGSLRNPEFTFDPGKEETYQYLANILKEVHILFPSNKIHIGGDEVSYGNEKWPGNPGIQALMKKNNLKDLHGVETYFMRRMADSVYKMGAKVLAWDEVAEMSLPIDKTIVYWWRHDKPEQLSKVLEKNYSVVLCPRIPFYFDFVQDSAHTLGRKWKGSFAGLKDIYDFDYKKIIASQKQKNVLGMQANIWTEEIATLQRLDYMLFPRISALAETAWGNKNNFDNFLQRLKTHLPRYQMAGIYYFNPFDVNANAEPLK